MSLQLCLFLSWLKFIPFLPKFYCFIFSTDGRATVVGFSKRCPRPHNNLRMKQLKSHVRHDDPEIMSISHVHVLLLSSSISLIVSQTLPSWSPVLVLKLPNESRAKGSRILADRRVGLVQVFHDDWDAGNNFGAACFDPPRMASFVPPLFGLKWNITCQF